MAHVGGRYTDKGNDRFNRGTVSFNMGMHRNAVTHDSVERESARYISCDSREQATSKVHVD